MKSRVSQWSYELSRYTDGRNASFPCSKQPGTLPHEWLPAETTGTNRAGTLTKYVNVKGVSECHFCGELSFDPPASEGTP